MYEYISYNKEKKIRIVHRKAISSDISMNSIYIVYKALKLFTYQAQCWGTYHVC